MAITSTPMPTIAVSDDNMQVYMTVNPCDPGDSYTVDYLKDVLRIYDIKMGVIEDRLVEIAAGAYVGQEVLVARGETAEDGTDGYYEFLFERNLSQKPVIREDGTADYHNLKMIELVNEGQTIAIYHPATKGRNGYDIGAKFVMARNGKDLPPLRGKGFDRLEDGVTYQATTNGKIIVQNERITIQPIHEVNGDVDITTGNIEFNGDVIIHGNVKEGMSVVANGTVTVDRIVESATVIGHKGVILRGGVVGKNGGVIQSKGNITARFVEFAQVEAGGDIDAESFLDSRVVAGGAIRIDGKKGSIVGGSVHGTRGIGAMQIGNEAGTATKVSVGVEKGIFKRMEEIRQMMRQQREMVVKIEEGLKKIEAILEKQPDNIGFREKKMQLVREKLRSSALLAGAQEELQKLEDKANNAANASVMVIRKVYPGVTVGVDDMTIQVKDEQQAVEFRKEHGFVKMFGMGITVKN